jgi:membrane protease YdiL (CAAX protease family)
MSPQRLATLVIALALGLATSYALDRLSRVRRIYPPGFLQPWRRWLALLVLAAFLGLAVFLPLAAAAVGLSIAPPNLSKIGTFQLFELHLIMLVVLGIWFLLGFAVRPAQPALPVPVPAPEVPPVEPGLLPIHEEADLIDRAPAEVSPVTAPEAIPLPLPSPPPPPSLGRQFLVQLGFVAPDVPREIGLGLGLGLAAWLAVLAAILAIAGLIYALGGKDVVPRQPPALIPLIAALPFGVRFAVSLSAGIVEETFFRGFLQPRVGIVLSTAIFALAHLSYGQPFMLVGVTLLSLIYGLLVRWRQSIWAAMAAHALFDGIQLLVVVPAVLKLTGMGAKGAAFLSLLP